MDALPEEVTAEHRARLEPFVQRARRIEAHSLLSDLQQFVKWVHGTAHLQIGPGGGQMSFELPPEEAFESLAARCRPFILESEDIQFHKVLGSLKAFARDNPELGDAIKILKRGWNEAVKPATPIQMGISSALGVRPDQLLTHVEIAHGWLNGDLVHADPNRRDALSQIPMLQRFLSSVLVYGQVAMMAKATLNVVTQFQDAGVLGLDPSVFTEPVAASTADDPPLSEPEPPLGPQP